MIAHGGSWLSVKPSTKRKRELSFRRCKEGSYEEASSEHKI